MWKGFFLHNGKNYLCVESLVVVVVVLVWLVVSIGIPAADVSVPTVVLMVVLESVVIVVVLVVSAFSLLFELSLQATKLPAIANTAKNFFMLRCSLFNNVRKGRCLIIITKLL